MKNARLDAKTYRAYVDILKKELIPALGCTEPIAVAYAAAYATAVLKARPERVEVERAEVWCSGNIVKNVKGVVVPKTGGLKGIDAAAIAGIVGGDAKAGMQVLEAVTEGQQAEIRQLLADGYCRTHLIVGDETLHIVVKVYAGAASAEVTIKGSHTNICRVVRDGEVLIDRDGTVKEAAADEPSLLNVRDIITFADTVKLEDIAPIIAEQIDKNTRISEEGLSGHYGVGVGRTLLKYAGSDIRTRAKARAAAGSDARMSGCALPVIINSGSGNQGMTASLPVITYAEELEVGRDRLYRALVLSNLIAIHQKTSIGKLSAFCGAVSAACGAGAAITYMLGGDFEAISRTITNAIGNVGGIVCDGAKPSCAAKIASAVDAALMAHHLAVEGQAFSDGEGLVTHDVEGTIANIGQVASKGMKSTDLEILKLMVGS